MTFYKKKKTKILIYTNVVLVIAHKVYYALQFFEELFISDRYLRLV